MTGICSCYCALTPRHQSVKDFLPTKHPHMNNSARQDSDKQPDALKGIFQPTVGICFIHLHVTESSAVRFRPTRRIPYSLLTKISFHCFEAGFIVDVEYLVRFFRHDIEEGARIVPLGFRFQSQTQKNISAYPIACQSAPLDLSSRSIRFPGIEISRVAVLGSFQH